jgi:ATP adenylyltransferase
MSTRFGWVTSGFGCGPDPLCDQDLLGHPLAAIVPTLGSLLPGWLLVVPRTESLAVRDLASHQRQDVLRLARAMARRVAIFGRDTFILEHGPSKPLSVVGCGVDQSHLHVVPMNGDLLTKALADDSVDWNNASFRDPWRKCQWDREYLLICGKDVCYIGFPRVPQSQFFRRKIAQIQGMPNAWDYRKWPYYENAQRTIEHFAAARAHRAA